MKQTSYKVQVAGGKKRMKNRKRVLGLVALAAMVVLALAGCGGAGEPAQAVSQTNTPAPVDTPTAAPTTRQPLRRPTRRRRRRLIRPRPRRRIPPRPRQPTRRCQPIGRRPARKSSTWAHIRGRRQPAGQHQLRRAGRPRPVEEDPGHPGPVRRAHDVLHAGRVDGAVS